MSANEQLLHRAVSLRSHGFLVLVCCGRCCTCHSMFTVANMKRLLTVIQIKISLFSNCFEQLCLTDCFSQASSVAYVLTKITVKRLIQTMVDFATGCVERWTYGWSSWFSTSSSVMATFFSVHARMFYQLPWLQSVQILNTYISQGSVATRWMCDEICNHRCITNFPGECMCYWKNF